MYRSRLRPAPFALCVGLQNILLRFAGHIFHGNALARVFRECLRLSRKVEISDELVVDHHPLGAVLPGAFRFLDIDTIDQFIQELLCQHPHGKKSSYERHESFAFSLTVFKNL